MKHFLICLRHIVHVSPEPVDIQRFVRSGIPEPGSIRGYLIRNNDDYNILSNYRIDRIADIRILEDKKRKPFSKLKDANGDRFNLGEYMKTHIKMYASGDCHVRFKITPPMVTDIIDVFGKDVRFEEETDTYVIVSTEVTENAMIQFAKSYSPDVVILEPQRLVDEMKDWAKKVKKAYGG